MRAALAAGVLVAVAVAGCGEESPAGADRGPTAASEVREVLDDGAVVIDVRTPSEFASGHLADAVNIDARSKDFAAKVGALDKGTTYVVYCASGDRAELAADTMAELGFDEVVNGGAFEALAAAGVPTG